MMIKINPEIFFIIVLSFSLIIWIFFKNRTKQKKYLELEDVREALRFHAPGSITASDALDFITWRTKKDIPQGKIQEQLEILVKEGFAVKFNENAYQIDSAAHPEKYVKTKGFNKNSNK